MKAYIWMLCLTCVFGGKLSDLDKKVLCKTINCNNYASESRNNNICGIREEGNGYRLRIFENVCQLLNHGCQVEKGKEYGLTNKYYCTVIDIGMGNTSIINKSTDIRVKIERKINDNSLKGVQPCSYINSCEDMNDDDNNITICAMRKDDQGFRFRKFRNECHLNKTNCVNKLNFVKTDQFLCDDLEISEDIENNNNDIIDENINNNKYESVRLNNVTSLKHKKIVVINASTLDFGGNLNETLDEFFASTHFIKVPLNEVQLDTVISNETRRKALLTSAGPIKVFTPWIKIPKNRSDDYYHIPTLSSCYHKCPEQCPDTYAPVCGVPGVKAREPSLIFQNHCFMDKAQCKMYWENKSSTALSSAYTEASFIFCLGYELSGVYRFLSLLRTLQHMGRIKKGYFRHRVRNLRFFNELLQRDLKLMG